MPNYVINTITLTGSKRDVAAVCKLLQNKNADSSEDIDFNNVIPMPKSLNLISGGWDKWYVGAYIQTLSESDKIGLVQKLLKCSDGYYKSYYHKYMDAFCKEIPSDILLKMQEEFRENYKSIAPSSVEEVGKTYVDNILNYGADTWYDWSCNNWGTKWGAIDSYIIGNCIGFQTAWSAALPITAKLSEIFPNVTFSHEWADEDIGSNCGRYEFLGGKAFNEYLPQGEEAVLYACEMWGYDPKDFGVEEEHCVDGLLDEDVPC